MYEGTWAGPGLGNGLRAQFNRADSSEYIYAYRLIMAFPFELCCALLVAGAGVGVARGFQDVGLKFGLVGGLSLEGDVLPLVSGGSGDVGALSLFGAELCGIGGGALEARPIRSISMSAFPGGLDHDLFVLVVFAVLGLVVELA